MCFQIIKVTNNFQFFFWLTAVQKEEQNTLRNMQKRKTWSRLPKSSQTSCRIKAGRTHWQQNTYTAKREKRTKCSIGNKRCNDPKGWHVNQARVFWCKRLENGRLPGMRAEKRYFVYAVKSGLTSEGKLDMCKERPPILWVRGEPVQYLQTWIGRAFGSVVLNFSRFFQNSNCNWKVMLWTSEHRESVTYTKVDFGF